MFTITVLHYSLDMYSLYCVYCIGAGKRDRWWTELFMFRVSSLLTGISVILFYFGLVGLISGYIHSRTLLRRMMIYYTCEIW